MTLFVTAGCAAGAGVEPVVAPVPTPAPDVSAAAETRDLHLDALDLDDAIAAVFDRREGAIERRVRYAYGSMGADRVSVVRWDETGGSVRSWLEVDDEMRWYPELHDRIEELTAEEEVEALGFDEMREMLDEAHDGSRRLLDGVVLVADGEGWWRGTDERDGHVDVSVRVGAGMLEHVVIERRVLDASGRDEWRVID